jgi:hypothetical protein
MEKIARKKLYRKIQLDVARKMLKEECDKRGIKQFHTTGIDLNTFEGILKVITCVMDSEQPMKTLPRG